MRACVRACVRVFVCVRESRITTRRKKKEEERYGSGKLVSRIITLYIFVIYYGLLFSKVAA